MAEKNTPIEAAPADPTPAPAAAAATAAPRRGLPALAIVGIVLGLPTNGPLLLRALQSQDMYLAGSFILILSTLTVIGTFLSDLLLAWLDPRIRFERGAH